MRPWTAFSIAIAIGVGTYVPLTGSAATTEATTMTDPDVNRLEALWREGEVAEYFAEMGALAERWSKDPEAARAVPKFVQLLDSAIGKTADPVVTQLSDLTAMRDGARLLLNARGLSSDKEREMLPTLAKWLGRTRAEIEPDYVDKPVFLNIRPPEGTPGIAGMDPNAIKDPVAREKYKAAIQENRMNSIKNSRQGLLRKIDSEFAISVVELMKRVARDPANERLVHDAMDQARLTQAERTQVRGRI